MQTPVTFFLVLLFVLALFGGGVWLVRRFAGSRLGTNTNRGRMPRLAVIDAAAVDSRRRLVLVRRDNIEHLLMIGGPTDIVVEPNIVRAQPAREQVPTRTAVPAPEPTWQEPETIRNEPVRSEPFDLGEPVALPEPPPRAPRTAFPDEPRRQPPPPRPAEPRGRPSDPFAGLTADLTARSEPPPPPPPLREPAPARPGPRSEPLISRPTRTAEPPPLKAAPPPVRAPERPAERAPAPVSADQNLAEMAQRLEAALRRPGADAKPDNIRPDSVDRAPPVAPDVTPSRPARTPAAEPAAVADSSPADAPRAPFKNLEEEMASLLGRPKNST